MLSPTSTFTLIPVIAVFAVLYLIIAIVLDRRRVRLARAQEAERDAKREHQYVPRRNVGSKSPTLLHRMGQSDVAPASQDIAWLNTWLTEEYPATE
jgi:hypothetical protein